MQGAQYPQAVGDHTWQAAIKLDSTEQRPNFCTSRILHPGWRDSPPEGQQRAIGINDGNPKTSAPAESLAFVEERAVNIPDA